MTKKDYVNIARALNVVVSNNRGMATEKQWEIFEEVVMELSAELLFGNPLFKSALFREAVYKK